VYQCHFPKEIFIFYLAGVYKSSSGYDEDPVLHTFKNEKQFVKFSDVFALLLFSLKIKTYFKNKKNDF